MRSILSIISLIIGLSCSAQDKPFEKVYLKNGSIVEGYISSQIPGKSMKVTPTWVEVVIPDSCVSIANTEELEWAALPQEWQDWAKNNPDYVISKNNKQYMTLHRLIFRKNSEWSRFRHLVKITGRGELVRFVAPCKNDIASLEVYGDTVIKIERTLRDKEMLTGIVDIIETKTGIMKGQIVEIIPGKSISIFNENGIYQINVKDIKSQGREFLNSKQNWKQQVPYLDEVHTKTGVFCGLVTKQTYNQTENSFTFLGLNNISEFIPVRDVISISKIKNADYKPLYQTNIAENEVVVCGKKTKWSKIESNRLKMIFASTKNAAHIDIDSISGHASIEMLNTAANKDIRVYRAKTIDKKNSFISLETSTIYEAEVPIKFVENEDNQTISYTLTKIPAGYYIIQRMSDKKTAAIIIEKKQK